MNTIFIDFKNNCKSEKLKDKYFKYNLKYDILNNVFTKKLYIQVDREYINLQFAKSKYSIYDRLLKLNINRKYKNSEEVMVVFSKEFDNYPSLKKYFLHLFRLNSLTRYEELVIQNKLKNNDIKHIDNYIKDQNKDINKLKILVVIDNIIDYDERKILEYISVYKFVDILITNNIKKNDLKKLQQNIDAINKEYGTTIDIIKKRNIQRYNVYLVYSYIDKSEFIQMYILSSKFLYINMKDVDSDKLSEEYAIYKRYKPEILTLLNRLNINKANFSKVKLGVIFK